jgi:hypothetical protein
VIKLPADELSLATVQMLLAREPGLQHLRAVKRGASITLVSGPDDDPVRHARLRRATIQWWDLDLANHRGTWERTHHRAPLDELVQTLTSSYPWAIADLEKPGTDF